MRTQIAVYSTGALISNNITLAKPVQETHEVVNRLLDGTYHVQVIGSPAESWELEFLVAGTARTTINGYAATKALLKLTRHGEDHIGVISGNPDWAQDLGSDDPTQTVYKCKITLLVTGGE